MKKAILLASVVLLGLLVVGLPSSEACHTHGYVRASTLNQLFEGAGQGELNFAAGPSALNDTSLNTSTYDDGHQFSWSVNSNDGKIHFGDSAAKADGSNDPYQQLEGVIGDIELALDAQYDKNYAD